MTPEGEKSLCELARLLDEASVKARAEGYAAAIEDAARKAEEYGDKWSKVPAAIRALAKDVEK